MDGLNITNATDQNIMNPIPLQSIESKGEKEAFELAKLLRAGHINDAAARLDAYAKENKCVMWEKIAIADIAKAINAGRKWKK